MYANDQVWNFADVLNSMVAKWITLLSHSEIFGLPVSHFKILQVIYSFLPIKVFDVAF